MKRSNLTVVGAKVDRDTVTRIRALEIKLNRTRTDIVKAALARFLDENPVSEDDLATARLRGSTATPKASNGNGADVVPIASARGGKAIAITTHELDGEGGILTLGTPPANRHVDAFDPPLAA